MCEPVFMMIHEGMLTEDVKSASLFEPVSEQHQRPDEWSAPLGFVIGGMAEPATQAERDGALAEQYFNAAMALIDDIIQGRIADYTVANAALFLYRHCFELLLKAGLPPQVRADKDIHHLGKLARSYTHHKKEAGETIPSWVIKRCDELVAIDPGSQYFRYGGWKDDTTALDEIHIDLNNLKTVMLKLKTALISQT